MNDATLTAALLALFAVFFAVAVVLARWTALAMTAWLSPPVAQVVWLRRFRAETGGRFRVSAVVDRLGRRGLAALTLQDPIVRFSNEQFLNRNARYFWSAFFVLFVVGLALIWGRAPFETQFFEALANIALSLIWTSLLLLALPGVVALAQPMMARLSASDDERSRFERVLTRIMRGEYTVGAEIVRIPDHAWRDAVRDAIDVSHAAIIDVTEVTAPIEWEIGVAERRFGAGGVVYIGEAGGPPFRDVDVLRYPADARPSRRARRAFEDRLVARLFEAVAKAKQE